MKTLKNSLLALILASPMALAQDAQTADQTQLLEQLETARMEVAEAAQRLARLQRELIDSESGQQRWIWRSENGDSVQTFEFDSVFDFDVSGHADAEGRQIRQMVFAGFPPRLGVLLGGDESGQSNRVAGVTPGGGAELAGIREDDRLMSVAGLDVSENTAERVRQALAETKPGDTVDVVIQRGEDSELALAVTLNSPLRDIEVIGQRLGSVGEQIEREIVRTFEGLEGMPVPPLPPVAPRAPGLAGLGHDTDLVSNHAGLEAYFGTADGVLVLRIADDNPLNLQSGDVILEIDGETIERPVDVGRALISRRAGDEVTVEVMRQRLPTQVYGTIPETSLATPAAPRVGLIRLPRNPQKPPAPPAPGQAL